MTGEDATFEVRIVGPGLDPRSLRVHSRATVLEVKRGAFGAEVAAGRRVTLVCQGQRLHDDRTLTSYGIASGVTLHCSIASVVEASQDARSADDGHSWAPTLLAVVLLLANMTVIYIAAHHHHGILFTRAATGLLALLSAIVIPGAVYVIVTNRVACNNAPASHPHAQ
ncbi:Ubiquitin-like domain-containing protein [Plasmodiophora brassicae]